MKNGSSGSTAGPNEYVRRLLMPSSRSLATTVTTWAEATMHNACTYSIHGTPLHNMSHTCNYTSCITPLHTYVATTLLFHTPSNNSVVPHPWQQPLLCHTPGNNHCCATLLATNSIVSHLWQQLYCATPLATTPTVHTTSLAMTLLYHKPNNRRCLLVAPHSYRVH